MPSAWSENVKWDWESDYFETERVIEMFRLNRDYKELVGMLDIVRVDDFEFLPCDVVSAAIDDDSVDNIKYLPGRRISVLVVADNYDGDITYLVLAKNTDGDRNRNIGVDRLYETTMWNNLINYCCGITNKTRIKVYYINNKINVIKNELCCNNIRLIYDDGG